MDGVYTADPRWVKGARKLDEITYDEMLELASLGAQVLHNRSVEMAKRYSVNLEVLSSFTGQPGTKVKEVTKNMEKVYISGVAKDTDIARIAVIGLPDEPGTAFKVFSSLGKEKINVDLILQSIGRDGTKDISFTVHHADMDRARELLEERKDSFRFHHIDVVDTVAKVSIVGAGMVNNAGVALPDVRGPLRRGDQHQHDLHLRNQDLGAGGQEGRRPGGPGHPRPVFQSLWGQRQLKPRLSGALFRNTERSPFCHGPAGGAPARRSGIRRKKQGNLPSKQPNEGGIPMEQDRAEELQERREQIENLGSSLIRTKRGTIHTLTIIGQIEGHQVLDSSTKTTKYEHVLPLLAAVEESDDVDGLLVLLNTVGGDIEAGLAIAELISGMKKPTVSLVLGGGHSIGVPLAVSARESFIAPSAAMTIHPVRLNGTIIGVSQTFHYFSRIQERILQFVTRNSAVEAETFTRLMLKTGELAADVGSVIYGEEAVSIGLIDHIGGLSDALAALHRAMDKASKEKENS